MPYKSMHAYINRNRDSGFGELCEVSVLGGAAWVHGDEVLSINQLGRP